MQRTDQGFLDFVRNYLIVEAKCYRHCNNASHFVALAEDKSSLVGGYTCPENYVSRVVYFSDHPDAAWFEKYLVDQLGSSWVRHRDIRFATRHGWELGGKAEEEIASVAHANSLREYYWTFYVRSDEDKKMGTFLCAKDAGGCGALFTKELSDQTKLCPNCRA
jgi:hypothetical protein